MIVFAPTVRLLPLTDNVAPAAESGADPSTVAPIVKVIFPVGAVLPLTAFTFAVRTVDALWAMLVGFAVNIVVVATVGIVTVTFTELELDGLNVESPA